MGNPTALGVLAAFSGDPLLTDALIRSRPRTQPAGNSLGSHPHDGMGPATALEWWQPEVRGHIAAFELHSGLHFDVQGDKASLIHVEPVSGSAKVRPVASIQRPPNSVFEDPGQVSKVVDYAYADGRRSRAPEIITQMLPQVPYWSSVLPLHPARFRRTFEFLGVSLHFAMQLCHRFKHTLAVPRPNELSVKVQPMIQTPGWSAFPSGHATEAFMAARLLRALAGQNPKSDLDTALQMQAKQIADNRVYAGLHYPLDSGAGQMLGETLAEFVLARSIGGKSWWPRNFVVKQQNTLPEYEFDPINEDMHADRDWMIRDGAQALQSPSGLMVHLWSQAVAEWKASGYTSES
jgi:PAP2 superfamily